MLGVLVDSVIHADSAFGLVELVAGLVEVFVVVSHGVVLFVDLLDEVVLVLRQLAVGVVEEQRILKLLALAHRLVQPMLLVQPLHFLPVGGDVVGGVVEVRYAVEGDGPNDVAFVVEVLLDGGGLAGFDDVEILI